MHKKRGFNFRMGAIVLAIVLLLQISSPAIVFAAGDLNGSEEVNAVEKNHIIDTATYTTRIKWGYSEPRVVLEFGFKKDLDDVQIFTKQDSDTLLETGSIQVNDGTVFTFNEAGIEADRWGFQYFKTNNTNFIKTFINDDELNVKIIEEDGTEIPFTIPNAITPEQRQEYLASLGGEEVDKTALGASIEAAKEYKGEDYTTDSFAALIEQLTSAEEVFNNEEASQTDIDNAKSALDAAIENLVKATDTQNSIVIDEQFTVLKDQWGTAKFDIALKSSSGEGTNTVPAIPTDQEAEFVKKTKIEINGKDFGTMEDVGFFGKGWPGANTFRVEGVDSLKSIKEVIHDDLLNVELILESGEKVSFSVTNELPEDIRKEIAGNDNVAGKTYKVNTTILQETSDSNSMSNPMFIKEADVEEVGDNVKFTVYVAFPVPAFNNMGTDGTLKNFFINYGGNKYDGVSDITTKPLKPTREDNAVFGFKEGELITTQVITTTLPKEAMDEEILAAGAFVNVVMNTDVNFRIKLERVEEEVDKSELEASIAKAEALKEEDYTVESYSMMKEKLDAAKAINNKADATQSEVDEAKAALEKAISELEEKEVPVAEPYAIDETQTFLKDNYSTAVFRIAINKNISGQYKSLPDEEAPDFQKDTSIEINGTDYGKMKDLGFEFSYGRFKLDGVEALKAIKDVINEDALMVKLTTKEGQVLEFEVQNELTEDQKKEISGEGAVVNKEELKASISKAEALNEEDYTAESYAVMQEKLNVAKAIDNKTDATQSEVDTAKDDLEKAISELKTKDDMGAFYEAKVQLVKANDHNTGSMAGAVLEEKAELLKSTDGKNKLVIHFQVAEVMGRTSYTTDFKLGDIPLTFVMKGDNSAVCVIDLPEGPIPAVYDGWINSNQMDSDVALKISEASPVSDNKTKLAELVQTAKDTLTVADYYPNTKQELEEAIVSAENGSDYVEEYAKIVLAMAKLRVIKENPFEGDTLFHIQVSDTGYVGGKLLQKWGRVTINDEGKPVLKVHYDMNDKTWQGVLAFTDVKVYDKDGNEMPVTYTVDKAKNGTLEFVMPYIPESGVFKVKEIELDGRENNSDLVLDYATIKKGPYRDLIKFAIEKYNKYLKDDWVTMGELEEKKDDFTESSWKDYSDALADAREALETPGIGQEKIDEVIENLKNARMNLVYQVQAGEGNTENLGMSGINNPKNFYSDDGTEKPEKVGWAGSKLIFGSDNHVFHILNNGEMLDNNGDIQNTEKMYILAEDLLISNKFTDKEVNTEAEIVRWNESAFRAYLNGPFIDNTLLEGEKKLLVESELKTFDMQEGLMTIDPIGDPITTKDKVFLPSIADLKNPEYGFASNDSRDTTFAYASRNVTFDSLNSIIIAAVKPKGRIGGYFRLNSDSMQGLPGMYLDTTNILMSVQADSKFKDGLHAPVKTESNTWKLIVIDDSKQLALQDGSVSNDVKYSTENAVGDDLIAMVVRDGDYKSGQLMSIGKVGKAEASGALSIDLKDFNEETDKLYLFAANESYGTSFATTPVEVSVDVNYDELLQKAKEDKKAEIDKIELTESEKEGMSADSIKNAENKLEELKDKAKEEVDAQTTIDGVKAVELPNKEEAKALLEKEGLANGKYALNTTILQAINDKLSMSDPLFIESADVVVKDDTAEFSMYVVYPIPSFPDLGKDGTLKDFVVNYKGTEYTAEMDIEQKPLKPAKTTAPLFGLTEGEEVSTQIIKFTLPKEALEEEVLEARTYVNAVMDTTVNFRIKLMDLQFVEAEQKAFEYEANIDNAELAKVEIDNDPIKSLKIVIEDSDLTIDNIEFLKDYDDKTFSSYNMILYANDEQIKEVEGTSFTITLPITEAQAKAENLEVFHLNDDNTKQEDISIINRTENTITFKATSFSPYVVASKKTDDNTNNGGNNSGNTDDGNNNGNNSGNTDDGNNNGNNSGNTNSGNNSGNNNNGGNNSGNTNNGNSNGNNNGANTNSGSNNASNSSANTNSENNNLPKTGSSSSQLYIVSFILFALATALLFGKKKKSINLNCILSSRQSIN